MISGRTYSLETLNPNPYKSYSNITWENSCHDNFLIFFFLCCLIWKHSNMENLSYQFFCCCKGNQVYSDLGFSITWLKSSSTLIAISFTTSSKCVASVGGAGKFVEGWYRTTSSSPHQPHHTLLQPSELCPPWLHSSLQTSLPHYPSYMQK